MTTIKIPADVWKLIIDKIEPEPYKLPKYVWFDSKCMKTKDITRILGPYKGKISNYVTLCFDNYKDQHSWDIFEKNHPKLYSMFLSMLTHYYRQSI